MRKANAFLLKKIPYREHGYIATFLTDKYGLCRTFISNKRLCHQLNLFLKLDSEFNENGEIKQLLNAFPVCFYTPIQAHLICAFYLNELVLNSLGLEDAYPIIFDCYENALGYLSKVKGKKELEWLLRHFELHLLEQLGYGISQLEIDQDLLDVLQLLHNSYEIKLEYQDFLPRCKTFLRQQINEVTNGRIMNFRRLSKRWVY